MTKSVLLTGASGYIAKHIALQLLEAGYHAVSYTHLTLPTIYSV